MWDEVLDYVFLFGFLGLGKMIMVFVIVNELGVNFKQILGLVIEKVGDLVVILNDLEFGDVFFIDEIYCLFMLVEEVFYSVMEDFYIDIMIGVGEGSCSVYLELLFFILIGVMIWVGMFLNLLWVCFGIIGYMEYYVYVDLMEIVEWMVDIFEMEIIYEAVFELVLCSCGIFCIVNCFFKCVCDFVQIMGNGVIDDFIIDKVLIMLDVDYEGLDYVD